MHIMCILLGEELAYDIWKHFLTRSVRFNTITDILVRSLIPESTLKRGIWTMPSQCPSIFDQPQAHITFYQTVCILQCFVLYFVQQFIWYCNVCCLNFSFILYCATCWMCCMVLFVSHCTVWTALDVTWMHCDVLYCIGIFFHTAFYFACCIEHTVFLHIIFPIVLFIVLHCRSLRIVYSNTVTYSTCCMVSFTLLHAFYLLYGLYCAIINLVLYCSIVQ